MALEFTFEMAPGVAASAPGIEINYAAQPAARLFKASMPVVLPAVKIDMANPLNLIQSFRGEWLRIPVRMEKLYLPKRPDGSQTESSRECKEDKLIALIDRAKKRSKLDLLKLTQSITSILDAED
jgi:hypothetical protein